MFNVEGQMWKQIAAASVIFALFQFSVIGMVFGTMEGFSFLVFIYSISTLFSFFNLAYVRDLDVIQVNFTPLFLAAMAGSLLLTGERAYSLIGMTVALIADGYFGLRFNEDSDKIECNALELLAIESWTQNAFRLQGSLALQISSVMLIFAQLSCGIVGSLQGSYLSMLFLTFALARLSQFFKSTKLGLKMAQSNMACIVLTVIGCLNWGSEYAATLSTMVMVIDSYIGLVLFTHKNTEKIQTVIDHLHLGSMKGKFQIKLDQIETSYSKA